MRVSIIIAALNAEPYVSKAIVSACRQTYRDIEVLVVDDGSRDRTSAVVRELAKTDGRIKLLRHDERKGVSAARNLAIQESTGDWIAILDADDEFAAPRIERMLTTAVNSSIDMLADNLEMRDFKTGCALGRAFCDDWMVGGIDISLKFLLEREVPIGLKCRQLGFMKPIIRRKFLVEHGIAYREDIWAGEDLLLYSECLAKGARMQLMPDALYIYYVRGDSASTRGEAVEQLRKVNRITRSIVEGGPEDLLRVIRRRGAMLDYESVVWHLRTHRVREAMHIVARHPSAYLVGRLGLVAARRLLPQRTTAPDGTATFGKH